MKKLPILMLSLMTFPLYAQSMLSTLNQHQSNLSNSASGSASGGSSSTGRTTADVKPSSESISSSSLSCEEDDQTSIPLNYLTALIQKQNGTLDIVHNPRSGTLSITSPDMIGNCSSMLEWKLKKPEIEGSKAYAVEVKIKSGENCTPEGCTYKVAKVEKGEFQKNEDIVLKPTLKGFEECLKKSGVIVDNKVVPGAIYSTPVSEKFSGLDYSGKLLFLSHGKATTQIKAKYGKFDYVSGCDHYEAVHPSVKNVLNFADAERQRLDAEAAKLKECKDYSPIGDFLERNQEYLAQLGDIHDKLLLEAAKKTAACILSTKEKCSDDELKVLEAFDRYLVAPKVELARSLYREMVELEGDAKKAKQAELKKVLAELSKLNQKPYFTTAHINKLLDEGKFAEAETMNNFQLNIENHRSLGSKQNNIDITPAVASQRISSSRTQFKQTVENEKERYEYKTGQVSGKAKEYAQLAQRIRKNMQTNIENAKARIAEQYAMTVPPNGHCTKYWALPSCASNALAEATRIQNVLTHINKVDEQRALEYEAKAKAYGELEKQGRRYIANQNGEEFSEQDAKQMLAENTAVDPRSNQEGVYTFDMNNGNQQPQQAQQLQQQQMYQQQAQMTPMQYQSSIFANQGQSFFQQQTPFSFPQQQQNFLGQQTYPYQNQYSMGMGFTGQGYQQQPGGYSFNMGGMPNQQPQYGYQQPQQGYLQQPYQGIPQYGQTSQFRW
jgi:hypothetical protein